MRLRFREPPWVGLLIAVLSVSHAATASTWLLMDPSRLNASARIGGAGLDGRAVPIQAALAACTGIGVPVAFDPAPGICMPVAAVAGLQGRSMDRRLAGSDVTVGSSLQAGRAVVYSTELDLACLPGRCPYRAAARVTACSGVEPPLCDQVLADGFESSDP